MNIEKRFKNLKYIFNYNRKQYHMLDYTTLTSKKIITNNNDEQQIDLLSYVVTNVDVSPIDILIVNEYYVARPDLISLAIYGNDRYGDIICKYNDISNPFEMNEGDIIYIPNVNELSAIFNDNVEASEFIDEDDKKTTFSIKELPFQKQKDEKRTPSQQTVGESNYVIDKSLGVVFY